MKPTRTFRLLNRCLGKALHRYHMIQDGDRIAVALSGGKDSLALMWLLNERRRRIPIDYELFGVYIDLGFPKSFGQALKDYGTSLGYRMTIAHTDAGPIAHGPQNRENPCFLCARLRRKRLFETAAALNCCKIALGHNRDDIIETLFINMCYAGEISTMRPVQPLFKGRFTMIRPLLFADEKTLRQFAREQRFPAFVNPCPTAGSSKRAEIKNMLQTLYRSNPKIKGNIFRSMTNVRKEYLL